MNNISINDIRQLIIPSTEASASGMVEKAVMPSIEYRNSFQKDHAVVPAARSTFSYSIYFVLYPTQLNIPFENLLYSFTDKIESTICLDMNLKSCAPSTISVCEILFMIL